MIRKLTEEEKRKILPILKSIKRLDQAEKKLLIARFRREQFQKGKIIKGLFGKPKKQLKLIKRRKK